jgi:hypothetical protein
MANKRTFILFFLQILMDQITKKKLFDAFAKMMDI